MPRIRHGLSKCFYCIKNGTPKAMPGAIKIDLTGTVSTYISGTLNLPERLRNVQNIGYAGKLTVACLPSEFCRDIFGWEYTDGVLTEIYTEGEPIPFQLMYQTEGTNERYVYYECYAIKPDISEETDTDTASVSDNTIQIYAYYDEQGRIKANTTLSTSKAVYDSWFGRRH